MTDIISRAQELAGNGHTKGPWFISAEDFGNTIEVLGQAKKGSCAFPIIDIADPANAPVIAFAPEAVQALTEEKFVYSVQVFMGGRWIFMVTLNTGNSLEEAAKWFPSRERAEYFASLWEPDTPARVVKRRVSPVVVDG